MHDQEYNSAKKIHMELGKAENYGRNYRRAWFCKFSGKPVKSIELFVKCSKTFRWLALIVKNFMSKGRTAYILTESS